MGIPGDKFSYIDTFSDYVNNFKYGTPEYFVYILKPESCDSGFKLPLCVVIKLVINTDMRKY